MKDLFKIEELDATASSSVVPSDDTAEIVEMLQAERAEEHHKKMMNSKTRPCQIHHQHLRFFVHSMCYIMLSMLPVQTTAYTTCYKDQIIYC